VLGGVARQSSGVEELLDVRDFDQRSTADPYARKPAGRDQIPDVRRRDADRNGGFADAQREAADVLVGEMVQPSHRFAAADVPVACCLFCS